MPGSTTWAVLALRAAGRSQKQIADALEMTDKGVQYHLKTARAHFGAANGFETIARAIAGGYITIEGKPEINKGDRNER